MDGDIKGGGQFFFFFAFSLFCYFYFNTYIYIIKPDGALQKPLKYIYNLNSHPMNILVIFPNIHSFLSKFPFESPVHAYSNHLSQEMLAHSSNPCEYYLKKS